MTTLPANENVESVTLEEAWLRANEFYHSAVFGDAESLLFEKLMREVRIYLLGPEEMARFIIKNIRLAQTVKQYFKRDHLTDIELSYFVLLVARGEIK